MPGAVATLEAAPAGWYHPPGTARRAAGVGGEPMHVTGSIAERIDRLAWDDLHGQLDQAGFARTPRVLNESECAELVALYDTDSFRKRVDMGRHRYGEGEYKYFADPLPVLVAELRASLYAHLAPVANRWAERLGTGQSFPAELAGFLALCHEGGQVKPTPLLLRYEPGGYNCLHQDLYGALSFPLQVVFVLSRLGVDFTGGEFLLVEQRLRAQSRGEAIVVDQGEALIFPNRHRPVPGVRGFHRMNVRHGVSTLRTGQRLSLGIIFHDAE